MKELPGSLVKVSRADFASVKPRWISSPRRESGPRAFFWNRPACVLGCGTAGGRRLLPETSSAPASLWPRAGPAPRSPFLKVSFQGKGELACCAAWPLGSAPMAGRVLATEGFVSAKPCCPLTPKCPHG